MNADGDGEPTSQPDERGEPASAHEEAGRDVASDDGSRGLPQINQPGLRRLREADTNVADRIPIRGALFRDATAGLTVTVSTVPDGLGASLRLRTALGTATSRGSLHRGSARLAKWEASSRLRPCWVPFEDDVGRGGIGRL